MHHVNGGDRGTRPVIRPDALSHDRANPHNLHPRMCSPTLRQRCGDRGTRTLTPQAATPLKRVCIPIPPYPHYFLKNGNGVLSMITHLAQTLQGARKDSPLRSTQPSLLFCLHGNICHRCLFSFFHMFRCRRRHFCRLRRIRGRRTLVPTDKVCQFLIFHAQ